MSDRLVKTSKFLSYVLRHQPGALGLSLDPAGWVDVEALVEAARVQGRTLDRSLIEAVIQRGDKQRFELSSDGERIRATYGHSIDVNLGLEPTRPPAQLFHGTARQALSSIRNKGLRPQGRQYVHLSPDRQTAQSVGARHGAPVVLEVAAEQMHEDGHVFYDSAGDVWLTDRVPPHYFEIPE